MSPNDTRRPVVDTLLAGRPRAPRAEGAAFAPANIALVKYWGKRDAALNLPVTSSLSISLGELGSETRVAPAGRPGDTVLLGPDPAPAGFAARVSAYLDLVRPAPDFGFRVETHNRVPTAAGFASSASGFAALALALDDLFGWALDLPALSILARLGSGSACRSVFDGFVEWTAGSRPDGMDSHGRRLDATWPALRLALLPIETSAKPVSSRHGMRHTVETSPLYAAWPETVARDLESARAAIATRDFPRLGATAEGNAMAMHATMHAARPPLVYWTPATIAAMRRAHALRDEGRAVYLTMDAGPNPKLLFEADQADAVRAAFPNAVIVAPFGGPSARKPVA